MNILEYALAKKMFGGKGSGESGGGTDDSIVAPIEGTAIPVGEPVERIYFNTNLSVEEVDSYLSQLTYVDMGLDYPVYFALFSTTSFIDGIVVIKADGGYGIAYAHGMSLTDFGLCNVYDSYKGWLITEDVYYGGRNEEIGFVPSAIPFYGLDGSGLTSIPDFNGIPVGAENEKIKNVLSITPFGVRVEGGDTGESGIVVCNLETVTKETTINDLENLNLSLPNVTSIDDGVFENCTALTSIDLPNATIVGTNAFYNCSALTSIDLPNVTIVCAGAFENCTALTSIDLPNATIVSASVFENCTALTSIDLPKAATIDAVVFEGCTALDTLILRTTETVCNLDVSAVIDTKILTEEGMPTGEGFIYVPTAFYEQYVSNLAAQVMTMGYDEATATYLVTAVLRKIEDYPEICG